MICDQNDSSEEEVSVPVEQCLDKKAVDRGDLMFSTLGRALPIEILVNLLSIVSVTKVYEVKMNLKARRPRLKAARAPFQLDKRNLSILLQF